MARIPYLNAAPFFTRWHLLEESSEGRWITAVLPPRQLGHAAEAGLVDAGLMAVSDLFRLEESFEPLALSSDATSASLGIANADRVDSVLLFLRDPSGRRPATALLSAEDLSRLAAARIGVTEETATSFRLLRLLLEAHHGIRPAAYERTDLHPGPADGIGARLVIGDQALRWRQRPPEGFVQGMDLASAWHDWTGLPFVFARWAVRRSLPEESKHWLGRFLESSLRDGLARLETLLIGLPEDLGPREKLLEYLSNFTYRLGTSELASTARFQALLREHGIACTGA